MADRLNPAGLLDLYRRGVFPMAETRASRRLYIVDPEERGVLPLDAFHVPRRLARTIRRDPFRISIDEAFAEVMAQCAAFRADRRETWINREIERVYGELHQLGHAHSVECWDGDRLAGGLYGVSLGAAFFGESMFSNVTDASKIALVALVARLRQGGYKLLDAQFHTDHLAQFGIRTIPRSAFQPLLAEALKYSADFTRAPSGQSGAQLLQSIAQTS